MKYIIFLFIAFSLGFSGCFYDNYTELYPIDSASVTCDTTEAITYSNGVAKIMSSYCTSCHSASIPNGQTILENYDGVKNSTASGKLIPSIRHASGHPAMPPNTQLDECTIRKVELWVQNNYAQ